MGKIADFCNALEMLGDGRYCYWNGSKGIGCSDYVRTALGTAGIITASEAKDNTKLWAAQCYRSVLKDTTRFKELPASTKAQKGDIMWYHGHHVAVCAGGSNVWEAAPESTHGICSNGKTGVGLWKNHNYNCSGGTLTCLYRIIEDSAEKMKDFELISKVKDIIDNYQTHYRGTDGNQSPEKNIGAWDGSNFCFDCSGVIKAVLWGWHGVKNAYIGGAVYASNGVPDINDQGFHDHCSMEYITNWNDVPIGACLWKNGHVGLYAGDGKSYECTPLNKNGVQETNAYHRGWCKFGLIPWVEYEGTASGSKTLTNKNTPDFDDSETTGGFDMSQLTVLHKGSKGAEVLSMQALLNVKGGHRLELDGSFGPATDNALKAYQNAKGLEVDGYCGPITWQSLLQK